MATELRFLKRLAPSVAAAGTVDWEAVYAEQLPRVYNFFRYRVGDDPLAEDLTAATFEKAWRARELYRRDLAGFSTWLLTIARNVAADHFRRPRLETPLDEIAHHADANTPDALAEHDADLARLSHLLAQLPDRDRELLALKYGAELTNRAIAKMTGLTESNVGTILHRIVQNLRAKWERSEG
jgi:RNA polymerase sigma-70 factor (ECF subfamily)